MDLLLSKLNVVQKVPYESFLVSISNFFVRAKNEFDIILRFFSINKTILMF